MGKAITIGLPVGAEDDTFLIDCAVGQFIEKIRDSGGTATPRGGVVAVGFVTQVVKRGRTRIGAVSGVEVPGQGIVVETVYLEPGWRGQGLLEPILTVLRDKAAASGLRVFLRGPVDERVERVGSRLGMVIGEGEPDDHPAMERIHEAERWMLGRLHRSCGHVLTVCPPCASAYYRRELANEGMYDLMRNGWVVQGKGSRS